MPFWTTSHSWKSCSARQSRQTVPLPVRHRRPSRRAIRASGRRGAPLQRPFRRRPAALPIVALKAWRHEVSLCLHLRFAASKGPCTIAMGEWKAASAMNHLLLCTTPYSSQGRRNHFIACKRPELSGWRLKLQSAAMADGAMSCPTVSFLFGAENGQAIVCIPSRNAGGDRVLSTEHLLDAGNALLHPPRQGTRGLRAKCCEQWIFWWGDQSVQPWSAHSYNRDT